MRHHTGAYDGPVRSPLARLTRMAVKGHRLPAHHPRAESAMVWSADFAGTFGGDGLAPKPDMPDPG